ncbi:TonB-dependent receptor, partial [Campylobacter jejuni]|nr:TonB-dependent receptor [Campylobacter jejuni]
MTQIKNIKFKKILICFLILSGALLKEEEKYQLNDFLVSDSGFEQYLVDAHASIYIIEKEEIEKKQI